MLFLSEGLLDVHVLHIIMCKKLENYRDWLETLVDCVIPISVFKQLLFWLETLVDYVIPMSVLTVTAWSG